jgi:hypothetical protein
MVIARKGLSETRSRRASLRMMKGVLGAPIAQPQRVFVSPSQRFMQAHSLQKINAVLSKYHATKADIDLFKEIIAQEKEGFLGYQAGSSTVRLFQDMISVLIKDVLNIPIKDDFVFLRLPGDPTFHYEGTQDFLKELGWNFNVGIADDQPHIRQHILSLNMNLYQSYDAPWDLTPRYFLENQTWTYANVKEIIKPLFASLGINGQAVDSLWSQALGLLRHDRGYILQFFDQSPAYAFTKKHGYIAHSGGKPHYMYPNHEILFDDQASNFPQIRMVMSNESTLNPFSSLSIKRYDAMTNQERHIYESSLRSLVQTLHFDPKKIEEVRGKLLSLWKQEND